MPIVLTPLVELPQEPGNPVRSRLALYQPPAPPRPLPEVGEAEKVETSRLLVRPCSPRLRLTAGLFETHQTGLVGMEAEPVLAESLRPHLQHPPRIALPLEDQHEVIGKADQESFPLQPGLHHRLKPRVQHLVEVDVRQERRDDSSLRSSCQWMAEGSTFHHSRLQPLVKGAADHTIAHPLVQKTPELTAIQIVVETLDVSLYDPASPHRHETLPQSKNRLMRRSPGEESVRAVEKNVII